MNYVYEIYKVLESKGCEQISMEFDSDYKVLEVKYKRKNQITDEMTNVIDFGDLHEILNIDNK